MPSQKNIDQVKTLAKTFADSNSVVLADYTGLTVNLINQLRDQLREVGGQMQVAKNTLITLALRQAKYSTPADHFPLTGQTAVVANQEDPIAGIKVLKEFAQENEIPTVKFGYLQTEWISQSRVEQLANLPGKKQLQAQLMATMQAPASNLARVFNNSLLSLLYLLKNAQTAKQE